MGRPHESNSMNTMLETGDQRHYEGRIYARPNDDAMFRKPEDVPADV